MNANSIRLALLICFVALMTGCSQRLISGLSEPEANEIVAVLDKYQISASKKTADSKSYEVTVSSRELADALQALRSVGLPKDRSTKLPDYVKKEGLVSTPSEERARLMYAIGRDMAQTIEQIDGVIQAKVHVVVPFNDPLTEKVKPSSASVFVRHRPGLDVETLTPKLKNLVLNGIEGLSYERVSVSLFEAEIVKGGERKPNTKSGYWIAWLAALAFAIGLGWFVYKKIFGTKPGSKNGKASLLTPIRRTSSKS